MQHDIDMKSLTILEVDILGIRVTKVQLMALYIFPFSKNFSTAFIISYLVIYQVTLKILALNPSIPIADKSLIPFKLLRIYFSVIEATKSLLCSFEIWLPCLIATTSIFFKLLLAMPTRMR